MILGIKFWRMNMKLPFGFLGDRDTWVPKCYDFVVLIGRSASRTKGHRSSPFIPFAFEFLLDIQVQSGFFPAHQILNSLVISSLLVNQMRAVYQLASGLLFLSLCTIFKGNNAEPTLFLSKLVDKDAAADLEDVKQTVQKAKQQISDVGLQRHYQEDMNQLDRRVTMIDYLLHEKYDPHSVPKDLENKLFEEDRRLIAEGSWGTFEEHGAKVLTDLKQLLFLNPLSELVSTDRRIHQFRKSIFFAIRLMIKHDLVENVQEHAIFKDRRILQQLLRCHLVENESNPSSELSVYGKFLDGDNFWSLFFQQYSEKVLQEAEEKEKNRHSVRIQENLKPKNMRFVSDYSKSEK
ncbi:hypothetical protein PGTUg99_025122 [Puccinia graminis f. sp. tritici]|uniref:Uncharacterized protein n=1 Tax=Puccinia graminis f. sp. tritici TaxID=56615 RepID=A0A5B0SKR6_PUCGR|nr:hypothetical protein PGTUg99_025122 [Puccinia graminis f. sp. tritici]